ncbi:probable protein phosphatase 2C 8 [Mercurialis annua]|uniref:probable protein phosphatase 2C 8 n=1 Tax=Mercurialis annua TaxID=3986 RepID=UPI002160E4A2|nr:probable protein phosphatase 2C 8 [Mercurialis annua]
MTQLTITKTVNSRRRRLKIRRLKYTCSQTKATSNENEVVLAGFGGESEEKVRFTTRISYGSVSVIGRRREMEDAVRVELGFTKGKRGENFDFFGVYDGHGGARVAEACKERLHRVLAEEMINNERNGNTMTEWEKVMEECFERMDEEVKRERMIGSTAVVAVVGENEMVVANCGDSRAVLCRGGVAVPLSIDHKPDREDELERVEAAGGRIINWNGHRILGVLATSRSIGDEYMKPFVISKPEVTVQKRTENDEFMILASDGLWDVVSNEVACQIARKCLNGRMRRKSQQVIEIDGRAAEAAAILVELAIARGSKDNISVIVVDLQSHSS